MTKLQEEQIRTFCEKCLDLEDGIPEDSIIKCFTSETIGMTKSQVKRFLKKFEEEDMIEKRIRIFWKRRER